MSKHPGSIYLITDGSGHVKVGWTKDTNPLARVNSLQTGNPRVLTLLGVIVGSVRDEKRIHREFAKDHVRGEWFWPSAALFSVFGVEYLLPHFERAHTEVHDQLRSDLDTLRPYVIDVLARIQSLEEFVALNPGCTKTIALSKSGVSQSDFDLAVKLRRIHYELGRYPSQMLYLGASPYDPYVCTEDASVEEVLVAA